MKSIYLRSGVALACALALAGCGGDDGNLLLGGSVVGLAKDGLVLQNTKNGATVAVPAGSSSFAFNELLGSDTEFEVTVKTQPTAAVCNVVYGKGKTGAYNVTSIQVYCITNSYDLGGTISGLTSEGLVLINGSQRVTVPANATSFKFTTYNADGSYLAGRIPDGAPYGVTVLTQPAGKTCTVANGTGLMGSTDNLTTVQVTCV
jgi:RNase P/RNase MRP subunit p29